MSISGYFPYVIFGKLTENYIIYPDGSVNNKVIGGNILYTAMGMNPWEKAPGLVARVGKNYPEEWLEKLQKTGFGTRGIKRLSIPTEHRDFIAYDESGQEIHQGNFLSVYFNRGLSFPKELLGYKPAEIETNSIKERNDLTILARDIPAEYMEARSFHFCPLDFISHNIIPSVIRRYGQKVITIQSSPDYMIPNMFMDVCYMIAGLSAFITTEKELRSLFSLYPHITDIREMAERLLEYGAENILIMLDDHEMLMLTEKHQCYRVKPYSDIRINPVGETEAFSGGFNVGYNQKYDPLDGLVYGMTAVSLNSDSRNTLETGNILPELLEGRMKIMRAEIRESE